MFWLTCGAIFQDDFKLSHAKLSLVAITALLPLGYRIGTSLMSLPLLWEWLLVDLPQLLEFVLMGWGLYSVKYRLGGWL